MVLALQKIIEELPEQLAIATGNSRTTSQTSSEPPSTDLLQKPEKATVKPEAEQKKKPGRQPGHQGKTRKGLDEWTEPKLAHPTSVQFSVNFCNLPTEITPQSG